MILLPPVESGRIVTLPALVAQISTSEKRLAVDRELENEAIYLRGVTVDASLIPKLAKVCAAEWTASGSTLVLSRPASLKTRLVREQAERFAPLMRRTFATPPPFDGTKMSQALAKFQEDLAKAKVKPGYNVEAFQKLLWSTVTKQSGAFDQASPAERGLNEVAVDFDMGQCVGIGQERTLTFTNLGGRLTKPLPSATTVLGNFKKTWGFFEKIARTVDGILKEETQNSESPISLGTAAMARDASGVAFSVYRNLLDSYEFEVRFFDRNGITADREMSRRELQIPFKSAFPESEEWLNVPISQDERTKTAMGLLQGIYGGLWPKGPRWTKEFLKDGEQTLDPLSVFATPYLDAMAERCSLPVLMDVPDGVAGHMDAESLGAIEAALRGYISVDKDDDVLLGTPRYPVQATADRFPRRSLPELIRMTSAPLATMEDGVRYMRNVGPATLLEGILYAACDHPALADQDIRSRIFTFDGSRSWVAALGELSNAQREGLFSGNPISVGTMAVTARRALADSFYSHDAKLTDLDQPPILYYPNGLPDTAVLRATIDEKLPSMIMTGTEDKGASSAFDWGRMLWAYDKMKREGTAGNAVDLRKAKYMAFWQTNVDVAIVVDGRTLISPHIPFPSAPSAKPVSWAEIPEPFKSEIHKGYEAAKAAPQDGSD